MEHVKSFLRKFYGRYGDLIKHYDVSILQIVHDILGHDHSQCHPQLIIYYTNLRTYYRTGPYYRFWTYYQISGCFHRTFQRLRLANRVLLFLRTPGPVPFGLAFVLMLRPFLPELVKSTDLLKFKHPSVLLFSLYRDGNRIVYLMERWNKKIIISSY